MSKNPIKQTGKVQKRDETASVVAGIADKTPRYVRMVMNGDANNDKILTATILYRQGKSKLIKYIEKAVPFN